MTPELRDWLNGEILPYLPTDRVRQGDKIMFRCPICGDSKKSSTKKRGYYYLKTASYHCFNCDANLSGMKLLEVFSGDDYESIRSRFFKTMFDGKHFGTLSSHSFSSVPVPRADDILRLKNALKPEWKNPLSERAEKYLRDRMVLDAPFLREKLFSYFSKKGGEYILIPWRLNGTDAYFQLNDFTGIGGMKYIFPKNRDKLVYGLDNIDISFPYLICFEGVYDSLFVKNGLAIGGKNLTALQESILRKRFPGHKVVFALDNDKPGLLATARTLSRSDASRTMYFKWFDSGTREKDINDLVKAKKDVNIFADASKVESMITDSVTMKMWLARNGFRYDGKIEQERKQGKVQPRTHGDFRPGPSREVQGKIQACLQVGP